MSGVSAVESVLSRLGSSAHVNVVFGEPRQIDGKTFIPVAKVSAIFGSGDGTSQAEQPAGHPMASSGSGGGGIYKVTPVAVVRVAGDQVTVVPVIDVGGLLRLLVFLLCLTMFWRVVRRR